MKRNSLLSILLTLLVVIGSLILTVSAAEATDADNSLPTVLSYVNPVYADVLSEEDLSQPGVSFFSLARSFSTEAEASAYLRDRMEAREETISVCLSYCEDVNASFHSLIDNAFAHTGVPTEGDYLWRHFGGCTGAVSYSDSSNRTSNVTITYYVTYFTTAEQEDELGTAVDSLLDELNLYNANDYEKICGIYDYMCENITYDYDNLYDDDYMLKYTAYAALIDGTAVCQGYANLFYRLALELDVDARYISGRSFDTPHGWNIVKLGSYYYNLDSTWDAGMDVYEYFLLCDANFMDHTRNTEYHDDVYMADHPIDTVDFTAQARILRNPDSASSIQGGSAAFRIEALNAASMQWQYRTSSSDVWQDATDEGSTTETLTVCADDQNGYEYRCMITDENGITAYSEPATLTVTKLNAPSLTVHNVPATGKPALTWSAADHADHYEVYRATVKTGQYTKVYSGTDLSWADPDTAPGVTYHYRVCAVNGTTCGALSPIASICVDCAAPVVQITNTAFNGKPTLTWEAVDSASTYEVYRATSESGAYALLKTVAAVRCVDGNAQPGTTYYYKVRAVCDTSSYGNSADSATVSIVCDCARPTVTASLNSSNRPVLTWAAVTKATSYIIYRSESYSTGYTWQGNTVSAVWTDPTAENGTTYYYKVHAVNAANTNSRSVASFVVSTTTAPGTPALSSVSLNDDGKPVLYWDAVDRATSYEICRTLRGGSYQTIAVTTDICYADETAVDGITYYYKIRALNGTAKSALSNWVCITVSASVAPAAPVITAQLGSNHLPVISWAAVESADSYVVYRTLKGGAYEAIAVVNSTSYTDTAAEPGVTYYYKVLARTGTAKSPLSNWVNVTVPAAVPDAPVITVKLGANNLPVISWAAVGNADSYLVYRTLKGGSYQPIATVNGNSYVDTAAEPGTTYYYKVCACTASAASPLSNWGAASVPAIALAAPTITVRLSSDGKPVVTWDAVENADCYEVFRTTKGGTYESIGTTSSLSYTDLSAAAGTSYYYKARALNGTQKSALSNWTQIISQ